MISFSMIRIYLHQILHKFASRGGGTVSVRLSTVRTYCHDATRYLEHTGQLPSLTYPVQLAGRKYLPGSWHAEFPKYLKNPQLNFPHVVQPSNGWSVADQRRWPVEKWANIIRSYLDDKLTRYGAILLRGLPIENEEEFSQLISQLKYRSQSYKGGLGIRKESLLNVMSASDEPKEYSIELHNEMAYLPNFCDMLFFYCKIPPQAGRGGQTCLAKGSEYVRRLGSNIINRFTARGIRYQTYLPNELKTSHCYLSWQKSFQTKDKSDVEQFCKNNGYVCTWDGDDNLTYYMNLPAVVKHRKTNQTVWFNQSYQHTPIYTMEHPSFEHLDLPPEKHLCQCYYGSGEVIDEELFMHMRSVNWQVAVGFDWQANDILVIDNLTVQHSRLSYEGPRQIFVSILNY